MQTKEYTFWNLLEEYSIEVPIIQRDYVQGRKKEERVRKDFLSAIYDSLINDKKLHLDFIYGVVKNDKFIPLDGQQRLTTLFLLHYYLAVKENKFEEFQNHLKKKDDIKFSYEIRESSREFCEKLVNNKINLNSDKKISDVIKDENWFFSKWKQDPTISSMLIMLDEIQNIFKENNLFEKLKNNITFSFLEPKKFNIKNENELYIKMNSRGKPLNEFENFKAHFTNFLDDENKHKFDNEWFDIFWNLKKDKLKNENNEKKAEEIIENEIFNIYLNFFKNITAFYSDKFNEVDIFKFNYKNYISEITKTLDCLTSFDDSIIYDLRPYKDFKINVFKDFLKDSNKITYEERLRFYALMRFFIKIGEINKSNESLLKQWMRISLNLINNTLYNKIDDFYRVKNLLDNLINLLDNNFYNKLSTSNLSSTKQFEEEKNKAKLIVNSNNIEIEFIKAEKNWYLDGQIGFLIEFAGGKNNFNLNKFKEYRDKFIELWNFARDNKNNQITIYRALLTKGNYLPKKGNNHTFCSFNPNLREKSENWHKVFNTNKNQYLKEVLNDMINKPINVNELEKEIIIPWLNNNNLDCENESNFEKNFIYTLVKNKENIKYCTHLQLRYENNKKIYLLRKTQMNGMHAELYTYDLYTFHNFKDPWEYYETNSWEQPCIYKTYDKFEVDILWDSSKGKFFIEILDITDSNKYLNKLLKNNNFINNNFIFINEGTYGYPVLRSKNYFQLCNHQTLIQYIKKLENDITRP